MDPTFDPAMPTDVPAPIADGTATPGAAPLGDSKGSRSPPQLGSPQANSPQASSPQPVSGEAPGAAGTGPGEAARTAGDPAAADQRTGAATLFPTPRHRRPTHAELAAERVVVSAAFIRGTIVFTLIFVLAMTILIWYRWYPVSWPSSTIQFVGDESVDGAVATVSREGREICSVTLDKQNDYKTACWLVPDKYDLVVTLDGRILQRTSIHPIETRTLVDTLSAKGVVSTRPARGPTTRSKAAGN